MPSFHLPNPLDALFLAVDEAWRRRGYPGAEIHWYLELKGQLDVPGLRRALQALYRIYPVTQARLACQPLSGRAVWNLGGPASGRSSDRLEACPPRERVASPERVVQIQCVDPPTSEELHRRIEGLLNSRLDLATLPPLQFTVLRGLPRGDLLVMRWPHGLMDARGGATIVETLLRLYNENPDPDSLRSAGDERRTDFGALGGRPPLLAWARAMLGARGHRPRAENRREIRLCPRVNEATRTRVRFYNRTLSADEYAALRATSMQVSGFARINDFVRACAIRALHEVLGQPRGSGRGYSTMLMVDNRRRRDPTPVCHNVFSTVPAFVPAHIARDRRGVADLLQDTVSRALTSGMPERRLTGLRLLAQVPTNILASLMVHELRTGRSILPLGMARSPSLPMTFMHLFPRPLERFCNAELVNLYGARPGIPSDGMVVNVSTAQGRMNVSGIHIEPYVGRETVDEFLDRFVAALTDPRG